MTVPFQMAFIIGPFDVCVGRDAVAGETEIIVGVTSPTMIYHAGLVHSGATQRASIFRVGMSEMR